MFFLLQHGEEAAHAAEQTQEHAEHVPILAQIVNHYFGEWAYKFEMNYTYPVWKRVLAKFGSTPEAAFGPYTPENAIPWYTIMFILACIITVALVWILKGRLSEDEPGGGQQTLEAGVLAIRSMLEDIIGPHDSGLKPDGILPPVHDADGGDQRHVRAWPVFVSLLQLHRHQRERHLRTSETLCGSDLVDCAAHLPY
jgi:hypothetical protein